MTTRIFFTICLLLGVTFMARSQEVKSWDSGPLTWSDFRGTPVISNGPAYLAADIIINNGTSEAVMYPEKSYASESERTPKRLSYFQTQFNLAELISRKLQQEIAFGLSASEIDARLNYYRDLYMAESGRLSDATKAGSNEAAIQQCEANIQQQLEALSMPGMSNLVPSPVRYGLWVGTGFVATTGSISNYFNTAWDFAFGALVNWRRIGLEASITFAYPTIKDHELTQDKYAGSDFFANVNNANYMAVGINAGYNVVDTKRFLLRPYIGGMWTSYSWTSMHRKFDESGAIILEGPQQSMRLSDFNLTFGVNFEWHFHRAVTSFPFLGSSREEYISSLRLTPYAIHSVYDNASTPFNGWQIGLTVAYSGVGRALKLK